MPVWFIDLYLCLLNTSDFKVGIDGIDKLSFFEIDGRRLLSPTGPLRALDEPVSSQTGKSHMNIEIFGPNRLQNM